MSKSHKLLLQSFGRLQGGLWHCIATGIDTDEGTPALWRHLEREGLVTKNTKSGRGILGHKFSYRITPEGDDAILRTSTPTLDRLLSE